MPRELGMWVSVGSDGLWTVDWWSWSWGVMVVVVVVV